MFPSPAELPDLVAMPKQPRAELRQKHLPQPVDAAAMPRPLFLFECTPTFWTEKQRSSFWRI